MSVNIEKVESKLQELRKEKLNTASRIENMEQFLLTKESGFVQTLVDKGIQKDDAFVAWFTLSPMAASNKTFEQFKAFVDTLESNPKEFSTTMQGLRDHYLVDSGSQDLKVFLAQNAYTAKAFNNAFDEASAKTDVSTGRDDSLSLFMKGKATVEKGVSIS